MGATFSEQDEMTKKYKKNFLFKNNERYHKNSNVQAKFSNSTGTFGKNVQNVIK